MEPATGGGGEIATCLRHPSQILTGICSSCLAERLATVNPSADRSSNPTEIDEIEPADERRPRRTLLSLFQSDDLEATCSTSSHNGDTTTTQKPRLDRGGPFSLFSRRWRSRRSCSSNRSQTSEVAAVEGGTSAETKHGSRHSYDLSFCPHPTRTSSSEAPRHSWDGGSVVGKAFACSFACLEEPPPQDGSRRVKMDLPQGGTEGVESRIPDGEPRQEEVPVLPGLNRKKSHRWSRVWDWSITSPFRDLVKKRDNTSERSLSESWREGRKGKGAECLEPDSNRIHWYANGHATTGTNQGMSRSINAASNGDHHNVWIDWQKKKESRFGRSRSVHYSSPGNSDNGLLRFYLTPLRSSRRNAAKGSRMRTSHSFARGILRLH